MIKYSVLFLVTTLCLMSCQKEQPKPEAKAKDDLPATIDQATEETYPSMTQDQANYLFNNADKVDVLFNDIAVSLSQVTENDVKGQISFLMPGSVPKKLECSESANIIFQSKGEIVADGRMYLRGKCRYIVFYEDNKPSHGAFMTDQGMKFYSQILSAGTSTLKQ